LKKLENYSLSKAVEKIMVEHPEFLKSVFVFDDNISIISHYDDNIRVFLPREYRHEYLKKGILD